MWLMLLPGLCGTTLAGCGAPKPIGMDFSAQRPRFILHQPTWGWPFYWPKVNALVIASEEDGLLWEIRSTDPGGRPARRLAIIYGRVPPGFYQVVPEDNAPPGPLRVGRTYFVGATGPRATFRAVFALPVRPEGSPASRFPAGC